MTISLYMLGVLMAVVGRFLANSWGARKELDNRHRQLRLQALVDAWRSVERATGRTAFAELQQLEHALADIQLFGSFSQAEDAARVARALGRGVTDGTAMKDLLELLRSDLRREMRLSPSLPPLVDARAHDAKSRGERITSLRARSVSTARPRDVSNVA